MSADTARKLGWGAIAVVLTALTIAGGWVWGASAASSTIARHGEALADHERRLRKQEAVSVEIRTDVRWIRQAIEKGGLQ